MKFHKKKIREFYPETQADWKKYPSNPLIGGELGAIFDISVLYEDDKYRMWVSWRPQQSIALVESPDGINWSKPQIVLSPTPNSKWEDVINRPNVLKNNNTYHMWYTGQSKGHSSIGYATSPDGIKWQRMNINPVLTPKLKWEGKAVMCPNVVFDSQLKIFRMWYSGGEQYEPNVIGYATSPDGINWTKLKEPIFIPDKTIKWEKDRVTAAHVFPWEDYFLMFYIGFEDIDHAAIGVARSQDGVTNWERHQANPIIAPTCDAWDHDACYKPYVIFDGLKWLLWYNGRNEKLEQIGLATHDRRDLGF
jgi:predicted GH43/DUF377 family glycosyl hydrolase